ncbi:MAG: transposase [Candidatus Thiodiazotropha sp.]
MYVPRRETVECSFACTRELHGHRYTRYRGLRKLSAQCLLSAAYLNIRVHRTRTCPKPPKRGRTKPAL